MTQITHPNVGSHIHAEILNHPADGFPIPRAPYTFHVVLKAHDMPAKITSLDVGNFEGEKTKVNFNLGECDDCSLALDFTVDFSTWTVGRHELRWHAKIVDQDSAIAGKQGQFTTSRSQICIESSLPNRSNRETPFNGGGSWYQKHGYQIASLLSPETEVKPGGVIVVRAAQDNVREAYAFLNPDFHNLSSGQTLSRWTNKRRQVVNIPSTAQVGDKLVLLASDGFNAGVFRMFLGDGTPRPVMNYEYQSWWSKSGLVLP